MYLKIQNLTYRLQCDLDLISSRLQMEVALGIFPPGLPMSALRLSSNTIKTSLVLEQTETMGITVYYIFGYGMPFEYDNKLNTYKNKAYLSEHTEGGKNGLL